MKIKITRRTVLNEKLEPEDVSALKQSISDFGRSAAREKRWRKRYSDYRSDMPGSSADKEKQPNPFAIFKKQLEKPLVSFMKKKLNFSDKAVNSIAKNIANSLKSKGLKISENKTMEEVRGSVGADQRGTKEHHKQFAQLKQIIEKAKEEIKNLKSQPDTAANRKKIKYRERAIRGAQMKARNLGVDLERVKGERSAEKTEWRKRFKNLMNISKKEGFGLVASAVLKYAVNMGRKDPQFMKAFGSDEKRQLDVIKLINDQLVAQFENRGLEPSVLKSI